MTSQDRYAWGYRAGRVAFHRGTPSHANAFDRPPRMTEMNTGWRRGWNDAERDKIRQLQERNRSL